MPAGSNAGPAATARSLGGLGVAAPVVSNVQHISLRSPPSRFTAPSLPPTLHVNPRNVESVWLQPLPPACTPLPVCAPAQVIPCSKTYPHDWERCPYAHRSEGARRRDPRRCPHAGVACPRLKQASAQRALLEGAAPGAVPRAEDRRSRGRKVAVLMLQNWSAEPHPPLCRTPAACSAGRALRLWRRLPVRTQHF